MSRRLPTTVPKTSKELLNAGMSRRRIIKEYVPTDRGIYVPRDALDEERPFYGVDPIIRARSYFTFNPRCIFTGLSALAFTGLRYFIHNQPTTMLVAHGTRNPFSTVRTTSPQFTVRKGQRLLIINRNWHYAQRHDINATTIARSYADNQVPALPTCRPILALGQAITALVQQRPQVNPHEWFLPASLRPTPGLPDFPTLRAIQLTDATLALLDLHIAPSEILERMQENYSKLINIRACKKVLQKSDSGCQSPPETLMRLILQPNIKGLGFRYITQVKVHDSGFSKTTLDALLIHPAHPLFLKVAKEKNLDLSEWSEYASQSGARVEEQLLGLQYDGTHHLDRTQRNKDASIDLDLWEQRLAVKRVTFSELADPLRLIRTVSAKLIEQR